MSYFTTTETFFVVPLDVCDGEIKKIEFLLSILEKSGVEPLIEKMNFKSSEIGRKSYNPYRLFATIIYCFAMHKGTLRNMEEMCRYDIRIWYLMNQNIPSYKTISEFINQVILPNKYKIFTLITSTIIKELNVDISDQYLDGTKIEANANKYKFVFKPRKSFEKLDRKIKTLLKEINIEYPFGDMRVNSIVLRGSLITFEERENIKLEDIPSGKGIRQTRNQKLLILGYKYLDKLIEYEEKEKICGPNRNSYYKSDHDATAMALKTDYYSGHGSNMKAAYNIQFLVSSGLITMFGVFQDRTDYNTLIPILENYRLYYDEPLVNLCADSGYGIFKNYEYLNKFNIGNYVKYLNWSDESSYKNPQRFFITKSNTFVCSNGCVGTKIGFGNNHQKLRDSNLYRFEGCLTCDFEYKCRNKKKNRDVDYYDFELSLRNERYKDQARKNLQSVKGIEIRINRSIQAEGAFGEMKQNMSYVRLRRRGMDKVTCEIMLMCLAINIRKLFSIYKKETINSKCWEADDDTKEENFKRIKPKKKAVTN